MVGMLKQTTEDVSIIRNAGALGILGILGMLETLKMQ